MPKLPTQRYLQYTIPATTDGGKLTTSTYVNVVRDLASVNRHNVQHTSNKGVPLVYRCAVTLSPFVVHGNGSDEYNQVLFGDNQLVQQVDLTTIPNTWVTRNAIVKTHAARENMFKLQGVKRSERGAYSKTMRMGFEGTTFLSPLRGPTAAGAAYDVSGWDYSALKQDDADLSLTHVTGDSGLISLYLDSRKQISADSNSDSDSTNQPVDDNILRKLLSPTLGISSRDDDVTALARDEADNPPYSLDNNGDHTDMCTIGRLTIGQQVAFTATRIIDIPLGLLNCRFRNMFVDAGSSTSPGAEISIEVLGVYEM